MEDMTNEIFETVGDFIKFLESYPKDWPVIVSTPAGGGISLEHREKQGRPFIAIFGKNGGRFGENPLTEDEYKKQSLDFLESLSKPNSRYTTIHGDHRIYSDFGGHIDSCFGKHYDKRIVERMVSEGLVEIKESDIKKVKYLDR